MAENELIQQNTYALSIKYTYIKLVQIFIQQTRNPRLEINLSCIYKRIRHEFGSNVKKT